MTADPLTLTPERQAFTQIAPTVTYPLIRKMIPGFMHPFVRSLLRTWHVATLHRHEPYRSVYPFTVASLARQKNLVRLAETIEADNIPGAIVECGVLDGGMSALAAWSTRESQRPIHMFDSWEGLPEPTDDDGEEATAWVGLCRGSPTRVANVMRTLGINPDRLHFHRGWFHETFPKADVDQVALVHIDCDFYDPTVLCLEHWWGRLSSGGFLQIDDYEAYQGCRRAIDAFLVEHPEHEMVIGPGPGPSFHIRKP